MAISHSGVITRRRLLQLAGGAAAPITLVSAPAGYGKTTLLRQWTPESGPVIRLDPAETPDHWQLWQQVSDALSLSVVTVIIDDLHLMEQRSWQRAAQGRAAPGERESTSGDRYPE